MKSPPRKHKRRQTRPEQIEEANGIRDWLFTFRSFGLDLIYQTAVRARYREKAALLLLDLSDIARALGTVDESGMDETWERYKTHFIGDRNRKAFFENLRELTWAVAAERLSGGGPNGPIWLDYSSIVPWDDSLMPQQVAPAVVRVATLYPGVLEEFLPRWFERISDASISQSTFMRAVQIVLFVPSLGWSAQRHTANLNKLNALHRPGICFKEQTVKKAIRDLRLQYRKHLEIMRPYQERRAARMGTSEGKK